MMGSKARIFAPQPSVTLDDLVPQDHFYRHLERSLDLGFVRDLVRERYAALGRPSIDPIIFSSSTWSSSSRVSAQLASSSSSAPSASACAGTSPAYC